MEMQPNDASNYGAAAPKRPTLQEGIKWTKRFRQKYCTANKRCIKGYVLNRAEIEKLLHQDNVKLAGLKIYFGLDENDQFRLAIVGTDEKANDFNIPLLPNHKQDGEAILAETRPCPIHCGSNNVLNSDQ